MQTEVKCCNRNDDILQESGLHGEIRMIIVKDLTIFNIKDKKYCLFILD